MQASLQVCRGGGGSFLSIGGYPRQPVPTFTHKEKTQPPGTRQGVFFYPIGGQPHARAAYLQRLFSTVKKPFAIVWSDSWNMSDSCQTGNRRSGAYCLTLPDNTYYGKLDVLLFTFPQVRGIFWLFLCHFSTRNQGLTAR